MEFYLLLIFVLLKINNIIDWSWTWVLAPSVIWFLVAFGYGVAKELHKK